MTLRDVLRGVEQFSTPDRERLLELPFPLALRELRAVLGKDSAPEDLPPGEGRPPSHRGPPPGRDGGPLR
ncbi:MAG: hypothetical protein EXS14_09475 [Planctomycetes bacterium]|nr:hypothetical protein [Planctomycetota bacterium]